MNLEEFLFYIGYQKILELCVEKQVSISDIIRCNNSRDYNKHIFKEYRLSDNEFYAIKGYVTYIRLGEKLNELYKR